MLGILKSRSFVYARPALIRPFLAVTSRGLLKLSTTQYARFLHISSRHLKSSKDNIDTERNGTNTQTDGSRHLGTFKVDQPQLMIAFTCKKCDNRSSHTMSKQAYTKGTVLITCPHCQSRHLIADHLKIFSDNRITIQDILKAKGESVSQSVNDLVFEDIPESLKNVIGHYAKDAPKNMREKLDNKTIHSLPGDK
ncbi:hypothetical protein TBLA_0A07730 [Henningerozyma blattae CBS 6284]|uniref:DNL-type domain-containing protein n=1 Tax=Henningerozyma blattae (strain ATCC 34711 / CBS 6284 / DSM 70876 / NBRC 10599 / NRRL Y-10934 / UCD 77-7) TaxID=1071380 RepID=I2GWR0_HENB6|nr:hypothetical protein TBLA_0A07730 [Tetrapisispora blattae CBS 6284]CCH58562.1 hypothetical protein TBLA_0A07730 [Tetrapisispora blattae CBS 6284]